VLGAPSLKLIGYWTTGASSALPDPRLLVDEGWDADERRLVAQYLACGTVARTFMGRSPCRICGVPNGFMELTDWTYAWPEGLAHYVEVHAVRLPREIVRHVLEAIERLDDAHYDDSAWRGAQ
jgi:hypothetical protein